MSLDLHAAAPPLETSDDGVVRVAGTRIKLEVVVREYDAGASAEDLVLRYPSLSLPNAYAVIAFLLRERAAVDAYLSDRASHEEASVAAAPGEMTRLRERLGQLRESRP
jgi:uncharacterized protein (DUF433 family)